MIHDKIIISYSQFCVLGSFQQNVTKKIWINAYNAAFY